MMRAAIVHGLMWLGVVLAGLTLWLLLFTVLCVLMERVSMWVT